MAKNKIRYEEAYKVLEIAEKVYHGNLNLESGIEILKNNGLNKGTAKGCIDHFLKWMNGEIYSSNSNSIIDEVYLLRIKEKYGIKQLSIAVKAFEKSLSRLIEMGENRGEKILLKERKEVLEKFKLQIQQTPFVYPEEEISKVYSEGKKITINVSAYERNRCARKKCLEIHGYTCKVCEIEMKNVYGDIGENFIHVHHKKELSEIGEEYKVDPKEDLVPLCPNCHAMIHRRKPAYEIEELEEIYRKNNPAI